MSGPDDDDLLVIDDDVAEVGRQQATSQPPWPILIVDDEAQVHQVTRFTLQGMQILGRPLAFESVYSAAEARAVLAERKFACILLDVVMEAEDAGLTLVEYIRDQLGDSQVRIILRTGQPGYAPEAEIIERYDINDYKAKSDLTAVRLITALTATLRSYQQILTIEANRQGLELILGASSNLMAVTAMGQFASGVLVQICALLHVDADGIVCAYVERGRPDSLRVLAASGRMAPMQGAPIEHLGRDEIANDIRNALRTHSSEFHADRAVLYIRSARQEEMVVHVSTEHPLSDIDRRLLEKFSVNIAIGFANANAFQQLESRAYIDPLTGLWSAAALDRALQNLSTNVAFAIVLADVRDFHAINEQYGHDAADLALQAIARVLVQSAGDTASIARVSADCFALLIEGATPASVELLMSTLHERVANCAELPNPIALAIGRAFHTGDEQPRAVLKRAQLALGRAKHTDTGA